MSYEVYYLQFYLIHKKNTLMKFLCFIQKTPLHIATSLGNPDIVQLLLHHAGININATDEIYLLFA